MRNDTERILKDFGVNTFGNKKNIEAAEALIAPDETLLFIYPTNLEITTVNTRKVEKLPGVVVLTNKRLCFSYQVMLSHSTEIVDLNEIRAVNSSGNGITGGHIQIHTMVKTYDLLVSYKKDIISKILQTFEDIRTYIARQSSASVAAPVTLTPAGSSDDIFEKIEKLSNLKEKGIISVDEFNQKKAELLEKI